MNELLDLTGRTVLVTGATGGIGQAIARKLARAGAKPVLHYRNDGENAALLAKDLNGACVKADLGSETGAMDMMAKLDELDIIPDLLVNNAGIYKLGSILDAEPSLWQDTNALNLNGVYALTKCFSNTLVSQGRQGAIVNIASITATDPTLGLSHYASSKAALLSYTRASALELGPHNIRVNAVSPGLISREGLADEWPEGVESWKNNAPLTRLGEADDVANAVLFLLSPAAAWISGSNLVVDGGMSVQTRW